MIANKVSSKKMGAFLNSHGNVIPNGLTLLTSLLIQGTPGPFHLGKSARKLRRKKKKNHIRNLRKK